MRVRRDGSTASQLSYRVNPTACGIRFSVCWNDDDGSRDRFSFSSSIKQNNGFAIPASNLKRRKFSHFRLFRICTKECKCKHHSWDEVKDQKDAMLIHLCEQKDDALLMFKMMNSNMKMCAFIFKRCIISTIHLCYFCRKYNTSFGQLCFADNKQHGHPLTDQTLWPWGFVWVVMLDVHDHCTIRTKC